MNIFDRITYMETKSVVKFVKTDDIADKVKALFGAEKEHLAKNLPKAIIEHVGGTSIPGSISKGDIDINIRVQPEDFEKTMEILKTIYKAHRPDTWPEGFACFKDVPRNLDIQLTIIGSAGDYFVMQREYLKNHPEVVSELNALKEQFEGKDEREYGNAKGKFFEHLNSIIIPSQNIND